jgi:hypothetical protein
VDDAGNVTQDGEEDVDEEISSAAALEEHSDWGNEDGEDDLDDVAVVGDIVSFLLYSLHRRCSSVSFAASHSE